MSFNGDLKEITVAGRAQTQFEVTAWHVATLRHSSGSQDRTIMKMPSFEMGKHGLHNDEKGFCIIILHVTNRLQATDYIIILKIGDCERKKHSD